MPLKDPKKRKEYHAAYMRDIWYPKNREKHLLYIARNKVRIAKYIDEYKRKGTCTDCGFSGADFPYVLDFDHKDRASEKEFSIGSWSRKVLSIDAIAKEIAKCELVCANCHRIRTFKGKKRRSD